jgi:hypothetical protein
LLKRLPTKLAQPLDERGINLAWARDSSPLAPMLTIDAMMTPIWLRLGLLRPVRRAGDEYDDRARRAAHRGPLYSGPRGLCGMPAAGRGFGNGPALLTLWSARLRNGVQPLPPV